MLWVNIGTKHRRRYTVAILVSTVPANVLRREAFVALAAFVLLAWQVLFPGFIGLANNGDFPKVAGRLSIRNDESGTETFLFFVSNYSRDSRFYWNAELPSSEHALAWIASEIEEHASDPGKFDIRWLGALHMLAWLAGYLLLLRSLRPLDGMFWWIGAFASLWIFMDVSYVSYFNSFYMDAAALLGAMIAVSAVPVLISEGRDARASMVVVFGIGAILYATSKGQHAVLTLIPAGLLIVFGWVAARRTTQVGAFVMAAALVCASAWVLATTPDWYRNQSRFNLIFFRILPQSPTLPQDARELGLAPSDLRFVGMHSFAPGSPANDPEWMRGFARRGSYADVGRLYLHHPMMPLQFLWRDLSEVAWLVRAENLSNFRREDGHAPGARTNRMATWSSLRSWLFAHWPLHMALWYGFVFSGASLALLRRSQVLDVVERAAAGAMLFAALMGVGEFCVASLADTLETYRHLLLFHLFTDMTIFFAIVLALRAVTVRQRLQ